MTNYYALVLWRRMMTRTKFVGGCWVYTGASRGGNEYRHGGAGQYGCARIRGKLEYTHRISVTEFQGTPIPEGFDVDHGCATSRCWNPEHLFVRLAGVNRRRTTQKRYADVLPERSMDDDRIEEHIF